jgi:hypothetical protein
MSHIAAATVPPGFVTRAISPMPWSALLIQATTSELIAASKVPSSQGSDSATPSRTCAPGMRSWQAAANWGVDRRDVVLADALGELDGIGELRRQPCGIAAHEAVVVLDCGGELGHGATKPGGGRVRQPSRSLRHGRAGAVTKAPRSASREGPAISHRL